MPVLDVVVDCDIHESFRVAKVAGMFDVPLSNKASRAFHVDLPGMDEQWNIGVIVGPSGSGKTTVARNAFPNELVAEYAWTADKAVLDDMPGGDVNDILGVLTSVGFGSPPSWIKPYRVLSTGEQFRCCLARAILENKPLFVFDEFTSVVDRVVAQIGSAAVGLECVTCNGRGSCRLYRHATSGNPPAL